MTSTLFVLQLRQALLRQMVSTVTFWCLHKAHFQYIKVHNCLAYATNVANTLECVYTIVLGNYLEIRGEV
jgi:hypothetical protein